jgi:hypothetical protein
MPYRFIDFPIREFYGENVATPGSASDQTVIPVRRGFKEVLLEPLSQAMRFGLGPKPSAVYFYDASQAAGSRWINLAPGSQKLVDRHQGANGTGTTLDSMQTTDFIYVGSPHCHGGVAIDVTAASPNGTASVVSLKYSKSDGTFATQAITDGTASGGATFAIDGIVKLDAIPTDWVQGHLPTILTDTGAPEHRLFWVQLAVSVALDVDTEFDKLCLSPENRAAQAYLKVTTEYTIDLSDDVGSLLLHSQAAGAGTVNITWIKR